MLLDKQKKRIMWTILIIAFIQMPGLALTPGINQMRTTAFPGVSLGMIQTALALAALAQPVVALSTALLVNRRVVTKKIIIIFGLCLLAVNGGLALMFNTEFGHLVMLSIVLGVSTGCILPNMFGLLFDNFEPKERQSIAGYQSAIINAGGITMSLLGGLLATFIWYGGYLVLFIGLPAAVLVFFAVPNYWAPAADRTAGKSSRGLNPKIYYYCFIAFLFMMIYSVCGGNLSTHIEDIGDSATAGVAIAFLMGGGVFSGLFFDKLSKKAGDYAMSFALFSVFVGYLMLSLFPGSLPLVFAAVFIAGMSLSIMLPRCIFMVSTLAVDRSTSQTATALVSTVAPSTGGFLSPIIFTNLTTALYGESTVARYMFVAFVVLAFSLAIAVVTFLTGRKQAQAT
jgi:MFS family permease